MLCILLFAFSPAWAYSNELHSDGMADEFKFAWPVAGEIITKFIIKGEYDAGSHRGIDIGAEPGTAVVAPADGKVAFVAKNTLPGFGGGMILTVDHDNDFSSTYLGIENVSAKKGELVRKGQEIAVISSSGDAVSSMLPHLHFGAYRTSQKESGTSRYIDPESLMELAIIEEGNNDEEANLVPSPDLDPAPDIEPLPEPGTEPGLGVKPIPEVGTQPVPDTVIMPKPEEVILKDNAKPVKVKTRNELTKQAAKPRIALKLQPTPVTGNTFYENRIIRQNRIMRPTRLTDNRQYPGSAKTLPAKDRQTLSPGILPETGSGSEKDITRAAAVDFAGVAKLLLLGLVSVTGTKIFNKELAWHQWHFRQSGLLA